MRKSTQKTLMALSIIFIFGLSSAAFVISGFGGNFGDQDNIKPLDTFMVEGEIDPRLEDAYIRGGFTFLKFYYNESTDRNVISFIEEAPNFFTTPSGQKQLIVIKINSADNYAKIININGENNVNNLTIDGLFDALCGQLVAPPTECTIDLLNITS